MDTEFGNTMQPGGTAFTELVDSQDRIWASLSNGILTEYPDLVVSLFRLMDTGALDESFNIPEIIQFDDNDNEIKSYANTMIEDSDGKYILGGSFQKYNGTLIKGLAKIEDNGDLISEFMNGQGMDEAIWGTWSNYSNITSIEKLPEGKLLIGGRFSSFGGEPYSCLVRLQPSGFVGLDDIEGRGKLKLYPNPAQNTVRFEAPDKNQSVEQIEIFDLHGRRVKSQKLNGLHTAIDVSNLHRGVYLVKARTNDAVYSQTLVLVH